MQSVLLVIHVIIALSLIGVILIQRSDSDGFGLGSGSGSGFMTGRSAANFLTRTTAILATLFIVNSLVLGVLAARQKHSDSIVDAIASEAAATPMPAPEEKAEEAKPVKDEAPSVPTE